MLQCATSAGRKERKSQEPYKDSKNSGQFWGRFFASLSVLFCILALMIYVFKVEKVTDSFDVEVHHSISTHISDYLSGNAIPLLLAHIDDSSVDSSKVGHYVAKVSYLFWQYDFDVNVADTKSPVVYFNTEKYVCAPNKYVPADYFVSGSSDSSAYSLIYKNLQSDSGITISEEGDKVLFSESGFHPVTLMAIDEFGNYSSFLLPVIVSNEPYINGVSDYYISVGESIDFLDGIAAYDAEDGDLTDLIEVTVNPDYADKPGEYRVLYSVSDSHGQHVHAESTVHTYDALYLQNLVNLGLLDKESNHIKGIINTRDNGYSVNGSKEQTIENIKSSVVRIHYETSYSRTNGSGYIVKIDDDSVIVCTNRHVVGKVDNVTVSLFDGTNVPAKVVNRKQEPDVAFVKINRSDIKEATFSKLTSMHVNLSYFNAVSYSPNFYLGMYCINQDGSEWLTRYGKIVRKSGYLSEQFKGYDYAVTEVTVKLTPGVSGSAIVDQYGNLICMATYYWKHDNVIEYYGVPLDSILDFYEETFGERLEYY